MEYPKFNYRIISNALRLGCSSKGTYVLVKHTLGVTHMAQIETSSVCFIACSVWTVVKRGKAEERRRDGGHNSVGSYARVLRCTAHHATHGECCLSEKQTSPLSSLNAYLTTQPIHYSTRFYPPKKSTNLLKEMLNNTKYTKQHRETWYALIICIYALFVLHFVSLVFCDGNRLSHGGKGPVRVSVSLVGSLFGVVWGRCQHCSASCSGCLPVLPRPPHCICVVDP